MNFREKKIIEIIVENPEIGTSQIQESLQISDISVSEMTITRDLKKLISQKYIEKKGRGKATVYRICKNMESRKQYDIQEYFSVPQELRNPKPFTFAAFDIFTEIFSETQKEILEEATKKYQQKRSQSKGILLQKEIERLTIDLAWKSSQIEGNTYDILETEMLIKESLFAKGHSKHEAQMILNHKVALDEIFQFPEKYKYFTQQKFLFLHTLLTKDLGIQKGLRSKKVRILGSGYIPPDGEKVLQKGVEKLLEVVKEKKNPLEKAFILLVLTSYLQAFEDGNKRTARISANALLLANNYCPLSYRSVDALEYKKTLLLFYEQNTFENFKKLFIEQYLFAAQEYFV